MVRRSIIKILLTIAVQYTFFLRLVDIVYVYLNDNLDNEMFMEQPPMFKKAVNSNKECKLIKERKWNGKLSLILSVMGF